MSQKMTSGFIFENNVKYSSSGILPLVSKEIAFEIAHRAKQLMRDKKDIFTVFSQDLSKNPYSWIESIEKEELEQLWNLNGSIIEPERLEKVIESPIKKHFTMKNTLIELGEKISFEQLFENFNSLITIEHAKNSNKDKNFNYFNLLGGTLNGERNVIDIAVRKVREECHIKFDNRIFKSRYQNYIRQNTGLTNLPLTIETCVNPVSRKYNRTYILLMENVEIINCSDETGNYIYVRLIHDPTPKFAIEENGSLFCKAGVMPFLRPKEANILAQVLDSINAVKMNKLIHELTSAKKIQQFEEEDANCIETAAVISRSIFKSEKEWHDSLTDEQINRVNRLADIDLSEKNKHYLDLPWSRNGMLNHLIRRAKESIPQFFHLIGKWDNLMIIEPIRERSIDRYQKTHFGYFVGNIDDEEKSTISASKRETFEEGCVVFDDKIYSEEYQHELRVKNGIESVPLFLEIPYLGKNASVSPKSTKVFLLFMEDIKVIPKLDEKRNLYYEVSV